MHAFFPYRSPPVPGSTPCGWDRLLLKVALESSTPPCLAKPAGAKQLEQHTNMMKAAIPGLFSAVRFVAYIRQQVKLRTAQGSAPAGGTTAFMY